MLQSISPENIGTAIIAIGALGTAAFALVDTSKIGRSGGVSNSGFKYIRSVLEKFRNSADEGKLAEILHGLWINGAPLADQKAVAKSMIKLQLLPETAVAFAAATHVSSTILVTIARKMETGDK